MPIGRIFWFGGTRRDIHVLRGGTSRDLTVDSLKFVDDQGTTRAADEYLSVVSDVTLTFTPLFRGTPPAAQGGDYVGDSNGITVNTATGAVTVAAGTPPNRKNNFIIEVVARNNVGGKTFTETIRVQVHGSVTQVWLTPSRLTIRNLDSLTSIIFSRYRFAVRAQFDDGIVGDLTDGHGVIWNEPSGHLNAEGRVGVGPDDHFGDHFGVTATLPTGLGGTTTPDGPAVHIGQQWNTDPARPKINIVAGGGLPQTGEVENSVNVLMVSDGFRPQDEGAFDQIVDLLVHFFKSSQITSPYNLLAEKINFWKVFFPADTLGISFQSEMAIIGLDHYAQPIPAVSKPPPDPAAQWDISNLLYEVGLPVPGDEMKDSATLIQEWRKLLQNDPAPHMPPVTTKTDLIGQWKTLAKRSFIEEQDNFPGLTLGNVPTANASDTTTLNLHPDRGTIQLLRSVCGLLDSDDGALADGRPLGVLWTEDSFRFPNRDFVIVISPCRAGRSANWRSVELGRYVAVSCAGTKPLKIPRAIGNIYIPVLPVAGKKSYTLEMDTVNGDVEADGARTVAHELGHSLGLGDEYPEFLARFEKRSADAGFANLQSEHDAQIVDPNDPTKRILEGDQISWIWHRIVNAAVVDGRITDAGGGKFRIPVLPDVTFRFSKGDTVLLRQRRWGQFLHKLAAGDVSAELILASDPGSDFIVVTAAPGVNADLPTLQAFAAGSLVYTPKQAPASVRSASYPFAEMVAKNVKDAISKNKMPLTAVPCTYDDTTQFPRVDTEDGRHPVQDFHLDDANDLPRVVGLYSGGATFSCGIFHPTGLCMMRNQDDSQAEFCAVCRYILVDLIAPEFHPNIDSNYEKAYPQK